MKIELIGVMIEILILTGIVALYFTKRDKAIAKVSMTAWEIVCGCSTLLAVYLIIQGVSQEISTMYIGECLLSWGGFIVLGYAKKYEKRMLGLYALIMDGVAIQSLVLTMCHVGGEPLPLGELLVTMVVLAGYTSLTILLCLSMVARRRPVKVKRWLRISFVCLGAAILLNVLLSIGFKIETKGWPWEAAFNMVVISSLVLCGLLHRRKMDSKIVCLVPFGFVVIGMLVRYEMRLLLVALLGAGIGAAVVWMKQSKIKLPEVDWKNSRIQFRLLTYSYGLLLFLGTLFPFLTGASLWNSFYNLITLGYGVLVTVLLMLDQPRLSRLQYVAAIVWNTAITIVGMVLFREIGFYEVILIWILLCPVAAFFLQSMEEKKDVHRLQHLMCSLSLLGIMAIICGGLGGVIYAFIVGGIGVIAAVIYGLFFGNL